MSMAGLGRFAGGRAGATHEHTLIATVYYLTRLWPRIRLSLIAGVGACVVVVASVPSYLVRLR